MYKKILVKIGDHIATIISSEDAESWINSGDWKWEDESKSALILKTKLENFYRKIINSGK